MFCKYCGKPVDETTMRCKICGRPVGQLEGGNGFWDLTGEKPSGEPAADNAALKELQEQVQGLRAELGELQAKPAGKKNSFGAVAALLALLALAVGVFALFQLRGLAGKLEEIKMGQSGGTVSVTQPATPANPAQQTENSLLTPPANPEQTPSETENGEGQTSANTQGSDTLTLPLDPNRLYTPWELACLGKLDMVELDDGITYVYYPDYFDGPRGVGDSRKQDIVRRPDTKPIDKQIIFIATFVGRSYADPEHAVAADPGEYDRYWAKITLDENGQITAVERLDLGDRFVEDKDATDKRTLSIRGGAEEGEEGFYALIAAKDRDPSGARYAYVSEIIELYIRD